MSSFATSTPSSSASFLPFPDSLSTSSKYPSAAAIKPYHARKLLGSNCTACAKCFLANLALANPPAVQ
eukprot:CAMPEP_0196196390 /NCGR_PEP_ID=MMETSP0912-20130531/1238_1 /TAXON_ID=49265 /ORGANISM="Thalassiosira rotula, Strain GSO102" /LENGTH=67 /DNA_ID=CAMNT_0041469075 /DNA_START=46 /DNA_END=249 /DNA_ORIENTATION=+